MIHEDEGPAMEFDGHPMRQPDDGRTPLALAAGVAAGLTGGGLWAAAVLLTGYEIGYAAWGVGLLVGFAMTRVTANRTRQLAIAAAAFAVIGLAAGKVFIFVGSAGSIASELESDGEAMKSVVAWQLYYDRELDPATLAEIDALADSDTLSDAVWARMREQAADRLAVMSPAEREETARIAARSYLGRMGVLEGVRGQLTLFDLLWIALAVGTAHRMLAPAAHQEPAEMQPA